MPGRIEYARRPGFSFLSISFALCITEISLRVIFALTFLQELRDFALCQLARVVRAHARHYQTGSSRVERNRRALAATLLDEVVVHEIEAFEVDFVVVPPLRRLRAADTALCDDSCVIDDDIYGAELCIRSLIEGLDRFLGLDVAGLRNDLGGAELGAQFGGYLLKFFLPSCGDHDPGGFGDTPGFCYVLFSISEKLKSRARYLPHQSPG